MRELRDGDIEVDGYLMGEGEPVFATLVAPGGPDTRNQDSLSPHGHSRHFGRDYISGPVWGLNLVVKRDTPPEGHKALRELAAHWLEASKRTTPGTESVLRYCVGGVTSRIYGRPRGYIPTPNRLFYSGSATATAKFVTSDPLHYADNLFRVDMTLRSPPSGGIRFPTRFPARFTSSGKRMGQVTPGGDADTPVLVEVKGPISDPEVIVGGHPVTFTGSLAYDQWARVDGRTKLVEIPAGSNLQLSRRTFLDQVTVPPGTSDVIFNGIDKTGTSRCIVTGRAATYGF